MQSELGIVMKRLVLAAGFLALMGCESDPSAVVPPKEPLFVTNDCDVLSVLARDQYKLSASTAPTTVRLMGDDGPWTPNCNWKASGFNFTEVSGPEGEAATAGANRLAFHRPRYDALGVSVRTSLTVGAETTSALCRVGREASGWMLETCGPDPKLTKPRAAAPSPSDQTPDSRLPIAPANPDLKPRDVVIPQTDPGSRPGDNN
jgi:hypothetical protein